MTEDLRGRMVRIGRKMSDQDPREFLSAQKIATAATVDANNWPYATSLTYIYLGDDHLWLHTGSHHGHFRPRHRRDPLCASRNLAQTQLNEYIT